MCFLLECTASQGIICTLLPHQKLHAHSTKVDLQSKDQANGWHAGLYEQKVGCFFFSSAASVQRSDPQPAGWNKDFIYCRYFIIATVILLCWAEKLHSCRSNVMAITGVAILFLAWESPSPLAWHGVDILSSTHCHMHTQRDREKEREKEICKPVQSVWSNDWSNNWGVHKVHPHQGAGLHSFNCSVYINFLFSAISKTSGVLVSRGGGMQIRPLKRQSTTPGI